MLAVQSILCLFFLLLFLLASWIGGEWYTQLKSVIQRASYGNILEDGAQNWFADTQSEAEETERIAYG